VPSPQLSFGSSVHRALEAFYDRKLPIPPSEQELLDLLYEHWEPDGFVDLSRDEQVAHYRHAQQVLRRYHRRVVSDYRLPLNTEAWFELVIDDAVVVGAIDRIDVDDDGGLHVVDYKTNRRAQPRERVAGSLQLAIYALACESLFGRLPATVALDFVVAGTVVTVGVDDIDLEAAREAVRITAARVRAGAFEPTPNRLCDWCDFRTVCPAWPADEGGLGPAERRLAELRRSVRAQVRELREIEAGIERLRAELRDRAD
jgi:putative RecB family exonuclease